MGVIKRGKESSSQEIFVVNGARLALLGRPAIETLKIVQTVNAVGAEEVKEKFPNLSKGLGKLYVPDYVIKFDFSHQEEWPKWSRRFERFRQASGLVKEEESQINMLIYAMGDQANDILHSFKLNTIQLKQYHTVKTKFDEHFVVCRNVLFEQVKFNQRRQEEGKIVDIHHSIACARQTL